MSRLKYATCGNKQIPIYVASEVRDAGYRRLVDIIDPKVLNDTVDKVKAAAESNRLLSATQASGTSSVVITSMPHSSPQDPNERSTVVAQDPQENEVVIGRVTSKRSGQQVTSAFSCA